MQAGLDNLPFGRINHHRNFGDVRFGGDEIEECAHGLHAVEHRFVHVHINDLRAVFHLFAADIQRRRVIAFHDQTLEARRAGHIGALADVDEQRIVINGQRLQTGKPAGRGDVRDSARRKAGHRFRHRADMLRARAAAAADDVQEAAFRPFPDLRSHVFRRFVVAAEGVGQAGVRVRVDAAGGDGGEFLDILPQFARAQRAVQADGNRFGMRQRMIECGRRLAGERAAGGVGNGAGDHDGQFAAAFGEGFLDREHRRLGVEGVEHRFNQDDVRAAVHQAARGGFVGVHKLHEGDVAEAGVVDIRRNRAGAAGRANHACDKARLVLRRRGIAGLARQFRAFEVQLINQFLHAVIGHRSGIGVEGVGFQNVGTGLQIGGMDVANNLRLGDGKQVVVALQLRRPVGEALAAIIGFLQLVALNHRAHRAVEQQDALA